MKIVITIFYLSVCSTLFAQRTDPCELNTIQTHSKVDTFIAPDEIFISILTNEKENKEDLDELEKEIRKSLAAIGIDADSQLKIDELSSYYGSKFFGRNIKQRRQYELKVTTSKEAVSSIVALNKLDIGDIRLLRLDHSKKEDIMLELRQKAILKAKRQAESLVHPINQSVGKALVIMDIDVKEIEGLRSVMTGAYLEQEHLKFKDEIASAQIELKPILISHKIFVEFELK